MTDLLAEVKLRRRLPGPALARQIRLNAGLSQARLARELGVQRVTVARWESGQRRPRGEIAARYAQLLIALQNEVLAS